MIKTNICFVVVSVTNIKSISIGINIISRQPIFDAQLKLFRFIASTGVLDFGIDVEVNCNVDNTRKFQSDKTDGSPGSILHQKFVSLSISLITLSLY